MIHWSTMKDFVAKGGCFCEGRNSISLQDAQIAGKVMCESEGQWTFNAGDIDLSRATVEGVVTLRSGSVENLVLRYATIGSLYVGMRATDGDKPSQNLSINAMDMGSSTVMQIFGWNPGVKKADLRRASVRFLSDSPECWSDAMVQMDGLTFEAFELGTDPTAVLAARSEFLDLHAAQEVRVNPQPYEQYAATFAESWIPRRGRLSLVELN